LLLENQPHDSICGCSIDQTHDEMRPRFDQCEQIAEDLTYQAMRRIGANGPAERVYVFNPLPGERSDFAECVVPSRRGQTPVALVDENGRRWLCQTIESEGNGDDRVAVGFVAGDVPGLGYKTFEIEYARSAARRPGSSLASRRIENDSCIVEADPKDGTLRVEIRGAGVRFTGLNRLVNGGDRGDEYNYSAPNPDPLIDRPAAPPRIRVIERGPARSTLEIKMTYRLPAGLDSKRQRSKRLVSCSARVLVSLYDGVPRIDIRTEFENNAKDHRLRAHFPSGIKTDVSHAEQHFGVVTRSIDLPDYDDTWVERPVPTHPQKTFVDVNDTKGGVMIANRGLPEYEVIGGKNGATIALTLLRCVGWLSRNDYPDRKGHAGPPLETPDAQCPGKHIFEYSIIPHRGTWAVAYQHAHAFASPLRARWNPLLRDNSGEYVERTRESLPASASFVDVEGRGLVVSALKRAEDGRGTVVRLYNPLDQKTTGRARLNERWRRCDVVDMKEDRLEAANVRDGWARLSLRSNEIVTLRFS
jgi:alpha-mannosidase